jgi:hypothetical protein
LEAEAAGDCGAAVREVVEAGGDAGGVEGPVGVRDRSGWRDGSMWPTASRSRCVPSSRSWTWRVHSGTRESCRALSGATCADAKLVAGQPVGHPEADEAFDGLPRAPAPCERRTQAERLAELTQVDTAGSRLRHNTGRRRRTSRAKGAMTPAPDLFDVGVIESESDPSHFRVGVGHRVDGQHLGRFHAPLGPPAPPNPSPRLRRCRRELGRGTTR